MIIVISFLILLAVALILIFVVDWDSDSAPSIRDDTFWQNEFINLPSNDSCKAMSIDLSSTPHIAGYPEQLETGQYVFDLLDNLPGFRAVRQQWNDTVLDHFVSSGLRMSVNGSDWTSLNISEEILDSVCYLIL